MSEDLEFDLVTAAGCGGQAEELLLCSDLAGSCTQRNRRSQGRFFSRCTWRCIVTRHAPEVLAVSGVGLKHRSEQRAVSCAKFVKCKHD